MNRSLLSHSDVEKSVRGRFRDQELSLPFHYYGQFSVGYPVAEQDCVEAFLKILRDEVQDAPAIRIGVAERVIARAGIKIPALRISRFLVSKRLIWTGESSLSS